MDARVNHDHPPLIGIAAADIRPAETIRRVREGEPRTHEITIGLDYVTGVAGAGAMPLVLPVTDSALVRSTLEGTDGLCLPGGPDLDPSFYGQERTACVGPSQPALDEFQLLLAETAIELGMPVLAICRGMQILNVALGGDLISHLPADPRATLTHRQDAPGNVPGHAIEIAPESLLATVAGSTSIEVNSFHHQAIDEIGRGLIPIAWSGDGVIEAVESLTRPFVLGVQWHAELMLDGPVSRAIFGRFAEAALVYRHRSAARTVR